MTCTNAGGGRSAACAKSDPPTLRPDARGRRRTRGKGALRERRAYLAHEAQVEVQIVDGRKPGGEHLAAEREVPERTATEARTRVARAVVLDRTRVAGVRGVSNHQLAPAGEERPVATV